MDASNFDRLTRNLTFAGSRRRALAGLLIGAFRFLGIRSEEVGAKNKRKKPCPPCKKRKKGKCKATLPDGKKCAGGTCYDGRCTTCTDGVKNGRESDVDCGGPNCLRCAVGRACVGRMDCGSAFCVGGVCQACTGGFTGECGTDSTGDCVCLEGACVQRNATMRATVCPDCPPNSTCVRLTPEAPDFRCFAPCGSS
jgi:hypothetical protein